MSENFLQVDDLTMELATVLDEYSAVDCFRLKKEPPITSPSKKALSYKNILKSDYPGTTLSDSKFKLPDCIDMNYIDMLSGKNVYKSAEESTKIPISIEAFQKLCYGPGLTKRQKQEMMERAAEEQRLKESKEEPSCFPCSPCSPCSSCSPSSPCSPSCKKSPKTDDKEELDDVSQNYEESGYKAEGPKENPDVPKTVPPQPSDTLEESLVDNTVEPSTRESQQKNIKQESPEDVGSSLRTDSKRKSNKASSVKNSTESKKSSEGKKKSILKRMFSSSKEKQKHK